MKSKHYCEKKDGYLYPVVNASYFIIVIGFFLVTSGFYFFKDYGGIARSYYILILLPTIIFLPYYFDKKFFFSKEMLIFFLPIVYLALSSLWVSELYREEDRSLFYRVKPLVFLFFLFLATKLILQRYRQIEKYLVHFLVVVALISSIVSLWQYVPEAYEKNHWPRMGGMSLRGDINVTATLYGVAFFFCVYGLASWDKLWRLVAFAASTSALVVIFFSQSKVPLLCVLFSFLWLACQGFKATTIKVFLLCAILVMVAMYSSFDRVPFMEKLTSHSERFELWSSAIEQMEGHWLLGHGVGSDIKLNFYGGSYASHTHNILIDTLRFGGIFGFVLLSVQILSVFFAGLKVVRVKKSFLPVLIWYVFGVFFLLTNGRQPLVKPYHVWFFYWIPLSLLLAQYYLYNTQEKLNVMNRNEQNDV